MSAVGNLSTLPVAASVVAVAALAFLAGNFTRSRRDHRMNQVIQDAVAELATAADQAAVHAAVTRAVHALTPHRPPARIQLAPAGKLEDSPAHQHLVPVSTRSGSGAELGALLVDPGTASRRAMQPALQVISTQAALAIGRLRLAEKLPDRLLFSEHVVAAVPIAQAPLRAALGRAIHDNSLKLDYQPIVALDAGRVVGFEALLRWQHPVHGQIPPDEFINLAEESGLIVPIGEWALATAMTTAQHWPGSAPPFVSVNVSGQQFQSAGFTRTAHQLLSETGLPADRLVLEITESLFLQDENLVWEDLQRLRLRGVRVAIDDFGTGYSSLSYLRHVPLDVVKLDRLFISPLGRSARQQELVAGIVRLAQSLNLKVVAEGIETESQRDIAARLGCAYGQGYLFGQPTAAPEAYLSGSVRDV